MEKLSSAQLERIYLHLLSASPNDSLQSELLDHLACQLEQAVERGQSFEVAWHKVLEEANTKAILDLNNPLATAGLSVIPAYHTFDAQVSYKIPSLKTILKVGGSNLFNNYYRQAWGNPAVGGLYYVQLTFDELLN